MALRRPPTDPLAALEAYRAGRYAEHLLDLGAAIPGWAWVNALAHGNVLDIAAAALASPNPASVPEPYRPWFRARSAMAQALMRVTVRRGTRLRDVQRAVLLGMELELAATAEVLERDPVEVTALVLEALESDRPRR
jgi:hypothetical protein